MPSTFHNAGIGYQISEYQKLLWKSRGDQNVFQKLGKNSYLFHWNECPSGRLYCETGVIVDLVHRGKRTVIKATVIGDSMSQSSPWITPAWNLSWNSPYIEVHCNHRVNTFLLAHAVGYNRKYGLNSQNYSFYLANQAFLTPFRREFEVTCPISALAVGRESSTVDTIQSTYTLPAKRHSVSF